MIEKPHLMQQSPGHFHVMGPLTVVTVEPLLKKSKVLFEPLKAISLNFSAVTNVDSSSMALLLAWLRYAKIHKIDLKLSHLPQSMIDLSRVSGLDALLPVL